MSVPFPEPTDPMDSRDAVFLGYLEYFRSRIIDRIEELPESEQRSSRLPSGWTPIELLRHLRFVERRWLEWGFEGQPVPDPWGDFRDEHWYVGPEESLETVVSTLRAQAVRTRAIVQNHDLAEIGQPGPRWNGADPATLERVLFHLVQEFARHLGQVDIVTELAGRPPGD